MRQSLGSLVFALILTAVGAACVVAGLFERRMAIAQEDAAVLDFVDPAAEYASLEAQAGRLPWVSQRAVSEIHLRRAMLQYWQADYTDLAEIAQSANQQDSANLPEPELQALAANALFRLAQNGPQDRVTLLKNLDAAIRAYTQALRAGGNRQDVAFNYELAVRIRNSVGAGKLKSIARPKTAEAESDPNMHGDPGDPPEDMKVEQFQIRVPMDPRERQSQDQAAGTGAQRRRRG